jgi:hypothetical protein
MLGLAQLAPRRELAPRLKKTALSALNFENKIFFGEWFWQTIYNP